MNQEQLRELENTAEVFFNGTNPQQKASAQERLLVLGSSVQYIPQCQYILDNSSSQLAILVAVNSLMRLVTEHWNSFSSSQRVEMRNYLLTYLADKGPNLENYIVTVMIQLLCRITKLGWFDEKEELRKLIPETMKFLQASGAHAIIGLKIMNEAVQEMNHKTQKRTFTQHRKIAVSFREEYLFQIFETSLRILNQVADRTLNIAGVNIADDGQCEPRVLDYALQLARNSLLYDFIGTNPDESDENSHTALQIPGSWRDLIQDPSTMKLFFRLYRGCVTGYIPLSGSDGTRGFPGNMERGAQVLELLGHFLIVRRSLFSGDGERRQFLLLAMQGVIEIMRERLGFTSQDCYHQFCRLLGKIKSNYQLRELIHTQGYQEWIELAYQFAVESFQEMHVLGDSVYYILGLWAKMVSAVPYVSHSGQDSSASDPMLESYSPKILEQYLRSRLALVPRELEQGFESFDLEDYGRVREQVEQLPAICRYQYAQCKDILVSALDPLLRQYHELLPLLRSSDNIGGTDDGGIENTVQVVECQIAWVVYIIAATIGCPTFGAVYNKAGNELYDAELCKRVLTLTVSLDKEMAQSQGNVRPDHRLELAILYFIGNFRKSYLMEQHGMPSPSNHAQEDLLDPEASRSSSLSNYRSSSENLRSARRKLFESMFQSMGLGDHLVVVSQIIQKISTTLKYWTDNGVIIQETIDIFKELAYSYTNAKMLLSLEVVQDILSKHTADYFDFLKPLENSRFRTTWYATLAKLICISDDPDPSFERFMSPILNNMDRLLQVVNQRHDEVAKRITDVSRDLRGIVAATHNSRSYAMVFDALYPKYLPLFVNACSTWADTPTVIIPVLKFFAELVFNRSQRITFDNSSPNGILLFKETSKVITNSGSALLQISPRQDVYKEKYKPIFVCYEILAKALEGGYVNFGVFRLYNDQCLDDALRTLIQLTLSINQEDMMTYRKLGLAYFHFVAMLFRLQFDFAVSLDQQTFQYICNTLKEGLESLDVSTTTHAASAIDCLATNYVRLARKDTNTANALRAQIQANPSLMESMMHQLFHIMVFGEVTNQWTMARPLLPLILASEMIQPDSWKHFKEHVIGSQPVDSGIRERLQEQFGKLMSEISRSLDSPNRDKFVQRLTVFRVQVREFISS